MLGPYEFRHLSFEKHTITNPLANSMQSPRELICQSITHYLFSNFLIQRTLFPSKKPLLLKIDESSKRHFTVYKVGRVEDMLILQYHGAFIIPQLP